MTDARDAEQYRNKPEFDESRMILTFETYDDEGDELELELPAKYAVCGLCNGKGSHVNPSIDAHGLSGEDLADDPDFEEAYFEGRYDVTCYRCSGRRVEPVVDDEHLTAEQRAKLERIESDEADYMSERASEQRWEY